LLFQNYWMVSSYYGTTYSK